MVPKAFNDLSIAFVDGCSIIAEPFCRLTRIERLIGVGRAYPSSGTAQKMVEPPMSSLWRPRSM